jgi:hypothetical protein
MGAAGFDAHFHASVGGMKCAVSDLGMGAAGFEPAHFHASGAA